MLIMGFTTSKAQEKMNTNFDMVLTKKHGKKLWSIEYLQQRYKYYPSLLPKYLCSVDGYPFKIPLYLYHR